MSIVFLSVPAFTVSVIISAAGWLYTYSQYISLAKRDAAMWLDAKPIKEPEGH